jgi:hypothetical protein
MGKSDQASQARVRGHVSRSPAVHKLDELEPALLALTAAYGAHNARVRKAQEAESNTELLRRLEAENSRRAKRFGGGRESR